MNSIESDSEDITKNIVMKSNKETSNDTLKQKSGIYKIVNKVDGKYYVGSTKDFDKRWSDHRSALIRRDHPNDHLQRAWTKYGEQSFEFTIVEAFESLKSILLETEQRYLNIAKTEQCKCYNLNFDAQGGELSEYSIEKIRQKAKSRKYPKLTEKYTKEERKQKYGKSGISNPKADRSIYSWKNLITNETFKGTRYEFKKIHNISVDSDIGLIKGKYKQTKSGWTLDAHETV